MIEGKERARRIRAARELAGHRSPKALAKAMREHRFGSGYKEPTLRKWEREDHAQALDAQKLLPIATVCRVPLEFFYADMQKLPQITELPEVVPHPELPAATTRPPADQKRGDQSRKQPRKKRAQGENGGTGR